MLPDYLNPDSYPYFPKGYWPGNWPATAYQYWPWLQSYVPAYAPAPSERTLRFFPAARSIREHAAARGLSVDSHTRNVTECEPDRVMRIPPATRELDI